MAKSPKFMVFHLRELIYTLVFILLGIILIISLVITGVYEPGVYTSCVTLNGNPMDVKVTLDDNHINSITVDNVSNTITTMYPLVEPAFNDIANQIVTNQSLENIKFDDNSKYTYTILYNAIQDTIEKGKVGE